VLDLGAGSARSLRAGSMDLAVANIDALVLADLLDEIARVLSPGGRTVLGGFTSAETVRLTKPLAAVRLTVMDVLARNEWVCLIAKAEA